MYQAFLASIYGEEAVGRELVVELVPVKTNGISCGSPLNEGMFSTNICAGKQGATLNVTTTG
jgi:hypothetical protein